MAIRPCKAWNTPTMIIMIAANMMNPTAQPLVPRSARRAADDEYASSVISQSLLCCAAGHLGRPQRTTEGTIAPGPACWHHPIRVRTSRVDELPTRRPVWEVVWQATHA